MDIDVKYVGDDMTVQVFDEDVVGSERIGETVIKLASLCIGSGLDEWFAIQHKGKQSGTINLRSECTPHGQQLMQRDTNERLPPPQIVFTNGAPAQH